MGDADFIFKDIDSPLKGDKDGPEGDFSSRTKAHEQSMSEDGFLNYGDDNRHGSININCEVPSNRFNQRPQGNVAIASLAQN